MLGTVPRYQHARVPKPCCLFSPSFFLCLLFPSLPPPDTLLFSLLPPHAFLLFPVCYSSSFLTSRLPPLCHCFSLRSVVQHVSPVRRTWRLMLVPLKRFGGLNLFQVFLKEWSGWGTGSDMTAQQESLFGLVSDEDTLIQPRDYTHTHTYPLCLWTYGLLTEPPPHVPPLSSLDGSGQACSERPSDELPVLILLIDAMSDSTFRPCVRLHGSCPVNGWTMSCHAHHTHTFIMWGQWVQAWRTRRCYWCRDQSITFILIWLRSFIQSSRLPTPLEPLHL